MKSFLATAVLLKVAILVAGAPAPAADDSADRTDLETRSNSVVGEYYCGVFANADAGNAKDLISQLSGNMKDDKFAIAAHGCYRVACHNTSGVYVCNDNNSELTVSGSDVANAATYIDKHCCYASEVTSQNRYSIKSGQQFTQWGWNVALGYADCKAGATQRPSDAGGRGVNPGTCSAQHGLKSANVDW
ncbi:hypothetical protein VP1G_08174 [Cytospora mali]|uniref:Uncharacterized protein n=1 Tax=Cytospora mali TaxID=578113 RepID=A0A194VAC9_CYTMA|nr:hypothetical protein VP1G_08174 [Valsa mali var. pyri (nom. inval.)]